VAGAGYVALIGQCVACSIALYLFFSKKHMVRVRFRGFRFRFDTVRDILSVGFPTFVMQAVMPVLISLLNKMLFDYQSAVFILGVYFRISNFVILPVIGLNHGAMPVMGYNFGAKNKLRLLATYKTAFKVALIIMIIGASLFWIFPEWIMKLFSASGETLEMGAKALSAISLTWIPGSFVVITIGMFQALGHGSFALIISVVRQLGLVLPGMYILLHTFGINSVWYAYPLAEIVALAMAIVFMRGVYKRKIRDLPDGALVSGKGNAE
jgi:Na+-driven multidrug efflux pump